MKRGNGGKKEGEKIRSAEAQKRRLRNGETDLEKMKRGLVPIDTENRGGGETENRGNGEKIEDQKFRRAEAQIKKLGNGGKERRWETGMRAEGERVRGWERDRRSEAEKIRLKNGIERIQWRNGEWW